MGKYISWPVAYVVHSNSRHSKISIQAMVQVLCSMNDTILLIRMKSNTKLLAIPHETNSSSVIETQTESKICSGRLLDWTQWIFTYYSYTRKGKCPISPVTSNIHPVTRLQKLSQIKFCLSLSTAICLAFRIEIIISHFDFSFVSIMIHGFGLDMHVRSCYAYTYVHKYLVCWR